MNAVSELGTKCHKDGSRWLTKWPTIFALTILRTDAPKTHRIFFWLPDYEASSQALLSLKASFQVPNKNQIIPKICSSIIFKIKLFAQQDYFWETLNSFWQMSHGPYWKAHGILIFLSNFQFSKCHFEFWYYPTLSATVKAGEPS